MSALSLIIDLRAARDAQERLAETSSQQRKVRDLTAVLEKVELLTERHAQFERRGDALVAENEGAKRVLRRNPHDRRAQVAVVRLDARMRAHAKAWVTNSRAVRVVERQAAVLMGAAGSRAA